MPNTKSKKFDFSILLASLSIVLVICCAVICCVFGIGTDNQVAQAYTSEEIGVSNLDFTVDEGFYLKDMYDASLYEIESLIKYYSYFIPDVMDSDVDFYYVFNVGNLIMNYTTFYNQTIYTLTPIYLVLSQSNSTDSDINDFHYFHISVFISANYDLYFFEFTYEFVEKYVDEYILSVYGMQSSVAPYNYYINFLNHPQTEDTFANQIANEMVGDANEVYQINSLTFQFASFANLGTFFSPNDEFAQPPVVMPGSVYEDYLSDYYGEGFDDGFEIGHQEGYDSGYEDGLLDSEIHYESVINQLREELEYYRSLDLNYQEIQVFNIARVKPSTFVYDGVTYTSNSIVRTNDGWDVYSSTYLNEQLPENYGVGFSLFLEETIINSKFHIYPDILSWYNYTYCSPPAQDGSQECYQVNERNIDFSVGYRTQNGNIVKIGEFSNAPGMTTGNFVINQPTNEIVFFREESNLMQIGNLFSLITYQFDTESIYNDGYENGKTQGIQIGRQEGYNQGVLDANDYSFFSLFTSVFDAPISAIVGKWGDSDGDGVYQREGGMLNFYIPGLDINFAPFLLSLFTIAIIILVIRFIMARKS